MKSVQVLCEYITYQGETLILRKEFAVNKFNEGLFRRAYDGSWFQLSETEQFRATSPKEFMRKLRARNREIGKYKMIRGSACGW